MIISVIGSSNPTTDILTLAEEVGKELGHRGIPLVCGGLSGVMEAACRGSKLSGGMTIGILPGNDPSDANQWVDIPICTGIGFARNAIVVKTGQAVIAVGGAYGTLSEIGHALGDGIPVIGLNTWELSRTGQKDISIVETNSPIEAVEKAILAAQNRGQSKT